MEMLFYLIVLAALAYGGYALYCWFHGWPIPGAGLWDWTREQIKDAKTLPFDFDDLEVLAMSEPRDGEFYSHIHLQHAASYASIAHSEGNKEKLAKALGDVLIDAQRLATTNGINLIDVMTNRLDNV